MSGLLNYEGQKVVVTGAASGIGEKTAQLLIDLGAEVYALDIKEPALPVKKFIQVNLAEKESIDSAILQLPEKINSIMNCAGVAGVNNKGNLLNPLTVMTVNFIGARYMIEVLIPRLQEGDSISIIASAAGRKWSQKMETLLPIVDTKSFEEAQEWFNVHKDNVLADYGIAAHAAYTFSKEAIILWMKKRSYELSEKKIRLNTVSPGSTATPMSQAFDSISKGLANRAISKIGVPATPEDQAKALIFLGSNLASYVSGQDLQVDFAHSPHVLYGFEAINS
ncbi:SDR family oxidoreductase [Cytobacillus depressus]|uniref:SDR family oxidoreductase n=1 Tax=Cytobacillus depressus TaxID=1602942 RepID=A0A6L3V5F8_9BACI|nr:SDR family oxidoreductase [Cytobacillus depressus]KAB2330464.1 SDR family oxidoreductase [Cytobacillus depressus]